jgi:hypothetical protein
MRAIKGGQVGANGEHYKGGQFINTIAENPKKEGSKPRKPRKVQVAPFTWVIDAEGRRPIFSIVGTGACYIDRRDPSKGIEPYAPAFRAGRLYTGETLAEIEALCGRYNAGERWV